MKTYKAGDSIYYTDHEDARRWGRVASVLFVGLDSQVIGYRVQPDDTTGEGEQVRVSIASVIDLEEVSRQASEALERIRKRHEARSDLLAELLGKLGYFADNEGVIRYRNQYSGKTDGVPVFELVEEFRTRFQQA